MVRGASLAITVAILTIVGGVAAVGAAQLVSIQSDLTDKAEVGDATAVTLSMTVSNNSPDPLSTVSIELVSPADLSTAFGTVSVGALPAGGTVTMSGTFTIPRTELLLMDDLEAQNFKVTYTDVFMDSLSGIVKSERAPDQSGP